MILSLTKSVCHTLTEENEYFALTYVPLCLQVYVRTSAYVCIHLYILTCPHTYKRVCVCVYVSTQKKSVSIYSFVRRCLSTEIIIQNETLI